jgi:hypothetical protein
MSKLRTGGSTTFPLSPDTAVGMFQLYLQGRTLTDIRALNHQIGLGQIVYAAIEGDWYWRKKDHLDRLLSQAGDRALQAAAEGVNFIADAMAATRRLRGDQITKFLQSGDSKDLGDFDIGSIAQFKTLAELLLKLTGQDQVKNVKVSGAIDHSVAEVLRSSPTTLGNPAGILSAWAQEEAEKQRAKRR